MRRAPRPVEALVFLLALVTYTYAWDPDTATNALAHFDQTVAIVEYGTLSLNRVFRLPHAATADWSRREERLPDGSVGIFYYPAKAPGLSLLGVPIYAAARAVERAQGLDPLAPDVFWWNARILALALSAIPAALGAVVLARLSRALGAPLEAAVLGALAVALGSCYATFASVLYAHTPTAAALAGASYLVLAGEPGPRRAAWAGFLVGLATLATYQAAAAVPLLAGVLALRARRAAPLLAFGAGGLPPLAAFALVHWAEFGSPIKTAYDFQNPEFTGGREGSYFSMLGTLDARRVYELLLSPFRGLFFYSPVLAPAVLAAALSLRPGPLERRLAAALALALLAFFLVLTGVHPVWWGGYTTGPRLLVPGFVLLAPFAAEAYARWPKTTAALASISTAHAIAGTFVSVSVVDTVRNPLFQAIYPGLAEGRLGEGGARRNAGIALGLAPEVSLLPYAAIALALAAALARAVKKGAAREEAPPAA
jgi:hypothetical protein